MFMFLEKLSAQKRLFLYDLKNCARENLNYLNLEMLEVVGGIGRTTVYSIINICIFLRRFYNKKGKKRKFTIRVRVSSLFHFRVIVWSWQVLIYNKMLISWK